MVWCKGRNLIVTLFCSSWLPRVTHWLLPNSSVFRWSQFTYDFRASQRVIEGNLIKVCKKLVCLSLLDTFRMPLICIPSVILSFHLHWGCLGWPSNGETRVFPPFPWIPMSKHGGANPVLLKDCLHFGSSSDLRFKRSSSPIPLQHRWGKREDVIHFGFWFISKWELCLSSVTS